MTLEILDKMDAIRKSSRRAALVTAVGACIIAVTLAFSAWRLHLAENQVTTLQREVSLKKAELKDLSLEIDELRRQCAILRQYHQETGVGLHYSYGGDHAEAIKHFDRALEVMPTDATLLSFKAASLYKLQQYEKAEQLAQEAIKAQPKFMPPHHLLALIAYFNGQKDKALEKVRWILSQGPENYYLIQHDGNFAELSKERAFQQLMAGYVAQIKSLQSGLIKLDYYNYKVDGKYGPMTAEAIRRFCSDRSINRDEVTTEILLKLIQDELAVKR